MDKKKKNPLPQRFGKSMFFQFDKKILFTRKPLTVERIFQTGSYIQNVWLEYFVFTPNHIFYCDNGISYLDLSVEVRRIFQKCFAIGHEVHSMVVKEGERNTGNLRSIVQCYQRIKFSVAYHKFQLLKLCSTRQWTCECNVNDTPWTMNIRERFREGGAETVLCPGRRIALVRPWADPLNR